MTRRTRSILLVLALLAAALAIWAFGGFLWPRPQFDRPGTPWSSDSADPDPAAGVEPPA